MRGSAVGCAALVIALSAITGGARADGGARAAARDHFDRGVALANAGDYSGAVAEFSRANELSPNYSVLYNIGQAYVALDRPVQAFDALTGYLRDGAARVAPARRAEVEAEIARQRARIATLTIHTDTPNALITIDDEAVGSAPLAGPVRVAAGSHHLVAKLESGATAEQTINAVGEQNYIIEFTLGAAPREPTPAPPATLTPSITGTLNVSCAVAGVEVVLDDVALGGTPLAAPIVTAIGPHRVSFAAPPPSRERHAVTLVLSGSSQIDCGFARATPRVTHHLQRNLGYAVGAVGAGVGVAAVAHYLWNLGRYHEWQRRFRDHQLNDSADAESVNRLGRSIQQASAVSVGLGIAAGVAFSSGAVLLLSDGEGGARDHEASASPLISYSGRF